MRLVDDHEVGARLEEAVAPLRALHVVETDDRVRMHGEDALARGDAPLQPPRAPGRDGSGANVEANLHLGDPLIHQVRRTQNDGALDVAAVEQFAGDEQGLDRLPHPDVVRDEETHRVELESHEQGHELVCPGLHRDLPETPEGPRPPAQREQQGVPQQERGIVPAEILRPGQGETSLPDRLGLQRNVDQRPILVRSRDRTDLQRLRGASAEHDPLPAASVDQTPGRVHGVAHDGRPRAEASRAKAALQPAGSSNRITSKPRSSSGCRAGRSVSSMSTAT